MHRDLTHAHGCSSFHTTTPTGHEGSGTVIKVGKGVTRVQEGDSVLLSFSYCQQCKVRMSSVV